MRLIGDEGRALMVENQAGGLSTGREGDLHLSLGGNVVNITIGGDHVQVTLVVLSGAVEGNCELEHLLEVSLCMLNNLCHL